MALFRDRQAADLTEKYESKPDPRTHMCIPCAFVVFWYMIKILFLIIRERLDS